MPLFPKWRIYCETDGQFEFVIQENAPTVCPVNAGHTVNPNSVSIAQSFPTENQPGLFLDFATDNRIKYDDGTRDVEMVTDHPMRRFVAQDGSQDYTSIKAACDAETTPGTCICVYAGTYVELNPITIAEGVSLVGLGNAENNILVGAVATSPVIQMTKKSKLEAMTITGASGVGGVGVAYDGSGAPGSFAGFRDSIVVNCTDGVTVTNGPNRFLLHRVAIVATTMNTNCGIKVSAGGNTAVDATLIQGNPTFKPARGIDIQGSTCDMTLLNCRIKWCDTGMYMNDDTFAETISTRLELCDRALLIDSTGTNTRFIADQITIIDSTTWDLDLQPTECTLNIASGSVEATKINNPNDIEINSAFHSTDQGKRFIMNLGDMRNGFYAEPTKSAFGGGKQFRQSMSVFRNDNLEAGTWTDVTTEAFSNDGSTFDLFSGLPAANCVFIGADVKFFGLKVNVTTATTLGAISDLVYEMWDGATWQPMGAMSNNSSKPFLSLGRHFVTTAVKQHVRFGITSNTTWAQKTLNSTLKYWVRLRVASALASLPVLESIQLHTCASELGRDGYLEYFGDGRVVERMPWEINISKPSSSSPADQDVYLSDNINVGRTENVFAANTTDRVGLNSFVPPNMDTSFPLKIQWAFSGSSSSAGTVRWIVRWDTSAAGTPWYINTSGAPSATTTEQSITVDTVFGSSEDGLEKRETALVDLEDLLVRTAALVDQPMVWIMLERDGSNGADTYSGTVTVGQVTVFYVKWCEGGHLLAY